MQLNYQQVIEDRLRQACGISPNVVITERILRELENNDFLYLPPHVPSGKTAVSTSEAQQRLDKVRSFRYNA